MPKVACTACNLIEFKGWVDKVEKFEIKGAIHISSLVIRTFENADEKFGQVKTGTFENEDQERVGNFEIELLWSGEKGDFKFS